jgi:hypothetical protein
LSEPRCPLGSGLLRYHVPASFKLRGGPAPFRRNPTGGKMVASAPLLDRRALKNQYLAFFPAKPSDMGALKDVVAGLVALSVERRTLTEWAVNAGYRESYVRSLLCRIFCALGLRARRAGAGRKPSRPALRLFLYAWRRYGVGALPALRGAARLAEAHRDEQDPMDSALAPRLKRGTGRLGTNCKKQLGRLANSRRLSGVRPQPKGQKTFNRNLQTQVKARTPPSRKRL